MRVNEDKIDWARRYATRKHNDTGAVRKHSGEPYIVHPTGVAAIATAYGLDDNQIQAAWLHDTEEDAGATDEDLSEKFGDDVAELVSELTTDEDYRRAFGKESAINRELVNMTSRALDVKLCDMLYNSKDFPNKAQYDRIRRNIAYLRANRDLTDTQEELCMAICESMRKELVRRLDEATVYDLRNGYLSGITTKWWKDRQEPESRNAIGVTDAKWDKDKNTLWLKFETMSTHKKNTSYTEEIQFEGVNNLMEKYKASKTWPDKKKCLSDIIKACDVKVHSSDPSWYWQGMWEDDDKLGLALHKFTGTHGRDIWKARHVVSGGLSHPPIRLTKHLFDLVNKITTDDILQHISLAIDKYSD